MQALYRPLHYVILHKKGECLIAASSFPPHTMPIKIMYKIIDQYSGKISLADELAISAFFKDQTPQQRIVPLALANP